MGFARIARLLGRLSALAVLGLSFLGALPLGAALILLAAGWLVHRILLQRIGERAAAGLNLVVLSLAGTALAVELFVRLFAGGLPYYRPHELLYNAWPEYPAAYRYTPDASVEMRTYGDLAAMSGDPSVRVVRDEVFITDAWGFRNEPGDGAPAEIVLLGDSFTAGNGVTQEDTWGRRLETGAGLDVYNMGIPGSPYNSYLNLALEAERLQVGPGSTVVLVLFSGNDLDERYGPIPAEPELVRNGPLAAAWVRFGQFRSRSIVRWLGLRLIRSVAAEPAATVGQTADGTPFLFFNDYLERSGRTPQDIRDHAHFPELVAVVRAVQALAADRGASLGVVFLPPKEAVYAWLLEGGPPPNGGLTAGDPLAEALAPELTALGVPYIDLAPPIRAAAATAYAADGELLWWPDDTHPNPAGQQVIADLVLDFLLRSDLLPGS